MLKDMDDDSKVIFMQSIHDRYVARPDELKDMCLTYFAAKYSTGSDDTSKNKCDYSEEQYREDEIKAKGSDHKNTQIFRKWL